MKKIIYTLSVILIAMSVMFAGCKKSESPVIKFTYDGKVQKNNGDVTAKVNEEVAIIVEYEASGKIKKIDFRIGTQANEEITSFNSNKKHKITRTIKFTDSGNTQIKTSVMDENEKVYDFELKVKVEK
jgi:hypothetical protein